jgi:hypothetical protein
VNLVARNSDGQTWFDVLLAWSLHASDTTPTSICTYG